MPPVPKSKYPRDLSVDELRWLLMEKRRAARQERIDRFRRIGRTAVISPNYDGSSHQTWHTGVLDDEPVAGKPTRGRRILDGFLFVVEISAVLGFLFILFSGLNLIRELNQEVATALEMPTLTPTPLVVAVVLPSGHTPPDSPGGARFNEAEIPNHLRPLVQSLASAAVPTPGPEQANRLRIPAIQIDAPIVQGDSWEQLKKGVGQSIYSAQPGGDGNLIFSAHNDIFGEIFRYLDQLQPGDEVIVYTGQQSYTYLVDHSYIVDSQEVKFLEQTKEPVVTLISCYPYMVDNQRIVVTARLKSGG
jgi:sortase A